MIQLFNKLALLMLQKGDTAGNKAGCVAAAATAWKSDIWFEIASD